ncbi:NACHT and WD domain-containing protein [Colletotrichum abscissum]|uniref:NACHT and WD domain-containing protein n=2 Tax=Colletotrichum abscissum TaxID=1671311 RepID=A0A9P9XFK1_9PEZI|nr:NACHT and WD domain-containing protein [Colletotrichum abscissum]
MRFSEDGQKNDLRMGDVPLIFVVHSMGGLIVKEAYIQGQNDPDYQAIIKSISAITFLATPHRGTNLAEILNKILQSTFVNSSKQYISELSNNSFMLQKLNEQFRHIAPKLDIVSFYETQSTSIGVKNLRVMVLEKESSVLGYPGETSKALDADHHGICKYESPRDPNYVTVRNVLKSLISKILSSNRSKESPLLNRRKSLDVKSYLGVMELPDVDFIFFQDQWAEGTGQWIFEENLFSEWLQAIDSGPHLLWLNGGAGTGKS